MTFEGSCRFRELDGGADAFAWSGAVAEAVQAVDEDVALGPLLEEDDQFRLIGRACTVVRRPNPATLRGQRDGRLPRSARPVSNRARS